MYNKRQFKCIKYTRWTHFLSRGSETRRDSQSLDIYHIRSIEHDIFKNKQAGIPYQYPTPVVELHFQHMIHLHLKRHSCYLYSLDMILISIHKSYPSVCLVYQGIQKISCLTPLMHLRNHFLL